MQNLFARSLYNKETSVIPGDVIFSFTNEKAKNDFLKAAKREPKNSYRLIFTQSNADGEDAKSSMTVTQLDLHFVRYLHPQLSIDFQPGSTNPNFTIHF